MRGKPIKWVEDYRIYEEVDENGNVIGYTVVGPDGDVSEVFDTLDGAIAHARKQSKKPKSGYKL